MNSKHSESHHLSHFISVPLNHRIKIKLNEIPIYEIKIQIQPPNCAILSPTFSCVTVRELVFFSSQVISALQ